MVLQKDGLVSQGPSDWLAGRCETPPEYWSCACRWVAYIHTHRVTEIAIDKALPNFGDVVVVHQALKKPPAFENRGTTGVCLGDSVHSRQIGYRATHANAATSSDTQSAGADPLKKTSPYQALPMRQKSRCWTLPACLSVQSRA